MKVKGVIIKIYDTVQVTKDFKRRNFILEHNDRGHSEYISMELFQDHCSIADLFKIGDKVAVDFNLKGRKWTNAEGTEKYFNTLQAWNMVVDKDTEY